MYVYLYVRADFFFTLCQCAFLCVSERANERISERARAIFTVVFRILNSSLFFAALSDSSFKMQNVKLQRAHTYRMLT